MFSVLALLLLTLDNHEQLVFRLFLRLEDGNIDRVGLIFVRRAETNAVLRARLDLAFRVTIILHQSACENLDGIKLLCRRSDLSSADVIRDESGSGSGCVNII